MLLHGFPADAHSWDATAEALSVAGLRVLVPFQRGYVATARPRKVSAYRLKKLAADIIELLNSLKCERAHIVGHDWGGGVSWFLADQYSPRVASLVVASTPHPRALARTLFTSKQILLSWYLLFFQLPVIPEWILTRGARASGARMA
ncbi:alpha/beta fold hydrolase [Streptomyces sp. NPDC097107]|uniref:alpha/beta fold hydrolase n=1 Tax=Streptomyces sp. NPDC097107 TaxID=3366089 RepID=UPI00382AD3DC